MTETAVYPTPSAPQIDHAATANMRAQQCWGEVQKVLAAHRCRLQAALDVRPAGGDGSAAMVSSTVVVIPQP
jgi:hypothetical protein